MRKDQQFSGTARRDGLTGDRLGATVRTTVSAVAGLLVLCVAAAALGAGPLGRPQDRLPHGRKWIAAWAASVHGPYPSGNPSAQPVLDFAFESASRGAVDQTFRLIVRPDLWGPHVRLRFANTFGTQPLTLDDVFVGLQASGGNVTAGTNTRVTFDGRRGLVVAPGHSAYSDAVNLPFVERNEVLLQGRRLAVSFHAPGATGPMTWHAKALTTSYVTAAGAGSRGADEQDTLFQYTTTSWFFLDAVDVAAPADTALVACFGDSITDGTGSTLNGDDRWPDVLSRRLHAVYGSRISVVNAGIGGNQIVGPQVYSAAAPFAGGPSALDRLDRDVLSLSGLTSVVWLEGINDLSAGATVEAIVAGFREGVRRLHARGVHVIGATITSSLGATTASGSSDVDSRRQAINAVIRSGGRLRRHRRFRCGHPGSTERCPSPRVPAHQHDGRSWRSASPQSRRLPGDGERDRHQGPCAGRPEAEMSTTIGRRGFIAGLAAGVAAAGPRSSAQGPSRTSGPAGLAAPALRPLPLGSIQPEGWLLRQLRTQAAGLTGHLDEFWPDIADSQWFGGKAEGWERAPYWLDGAIPLAWLIDDQPLKARITRHITYIVDHQRADGWYSPYPEDAQSKRYDMWAILLANKALAQYHDATGDPRVLDAISRSLRAMADGLDRTPLYDWGRFRWYEGLVPIFHVYERTGEPWLLDLARKLREQGIDFEALFRTEDLAIPTPRRGLWKWTKHVVNTAMAAKASALSWRLDRRPADRAWANGMIAFLDKYHGQATGMFSGDECLSGRNPLQGTELCSVVEFMYSLEHLLSVFGDPAFGDRLERVAFNALPAAISPDMWSHQYDQQVNQVQCTVNPEHGWSTNGADSNLFGLEPNYGCCTSNMHQGWPKFAAHLWMRTADDGIAVAAYAPSRARFSPGGIAVETAIDTDYPFRERARLTVTAAAPARFPLVLRVPAWAEGASVEIDGRAPEPMTPGTLHRIEREWTGTTALTLHLPMTPRVSQGYNDAVVVERGPLVYALKLGEQWTRVNASKPHRELPHGDFEVRPSTPWNYGLVASRDTVAGLTFEERPVGERPFSPEGAGMAATARARRLPSWKIERGWAGERSSSDGTWADPDRRAAPEPEEAVTLIPYGCTNIRITEFPRVT